MDWLDVLGGLDRAKNSDSPIYAQIVERFRSAIGSGQLSDNMQLPTNRELASLLKIDRSTVSRAYVELERLGLVESHVGRGTFVRLNSANTGTMSAADSNTMMWSEKFSRASQTAFGLISRQPAQLQLDGVISFAGGIPTEEFFPQQEFENIVERVIQSKRSHEMFAYSPAEGHIGLRAEVLKYLAAQGIAARDSELLIVSGSQQGIDVVINTLIDPGDVVLIEEPTYFWALCNFSASQARLIPVPVDEDGLQVDVLETLLSRHRAKLLYLMPTFQNPTGSTLSLQRRKSLLELAKRYQLPVLEDNFVGDLRYEGEPLPSLRALDTKGDTIIHQATFSKALCPGLRLGWLVAPPEVTARLSLAKRASDLSTNTMAQAVMAEYLRGGSYVQHLEMVRRAYKARRDAMTSALDKFVGTRVSWSNPQGGLFIWAKLPSGCSARELLLHAEREGVTFSPGEMFFVHGGRPEYFRLSFIQSDEATIYDGIARLGKAVDSYFETQKRLGGLAGNRGGKGSEAVLI
jgi:DNA-binding transcriptional MocR family regulator